MEIDLSAGELCLRDNQPIRLRRARGLRITCTAGTVWLTVSGVPGDILLQPGDSHQLAGNGLALIESLGLGSGRIRLSQAAHFHHRSRVAAAIRRLIGQRDTAGAMAGGRLQRIG
jgi:hypothetical protein